MLMPKPYLLFLSLTFGSLLLRFQPCAAQDTWRRTFGGLSSEVGHGVLATADGGCIVSGSTGSFGAGAGDLYLLKVTETGTLAWSTAIGTDGVENGWSVRATMDGSLLIAGSTTHATAGGYDGWLVNADPAGTVLWQRTYGGSDWDLLYDTAPTASGSFAVGQTYSAGVGGDIWLLALNDAGDTLWTRTYGTDHSDEARSVKATPDGGCIVAGTIGMADGTSDAILVKFDATGAVEWNTPIGGTGADAGFGVTLLADGGYVLCGTTTSYSINNQRILLAKVLADGSLLWIKDIGDTGTWGAREVRERADGGLVTCGFTDAFGAGQRDMYLLFTDAVAGFEQGRTYGQTENDEAWAFDATTDGGYVVAGVASQFEPGTNAVFVVKGDTLGTTSSETIVPYLDPLRIDDLSALSSSPLFPNPAAPGSLVSWQAPDLRPARITLFDVQGRTVLDRSAGATERSFEVPGVPAGTYRLLLREASGRALNAPLVVCP